MVITYDQIVEVIIDKCHFKDNYQFTTDESKWRFQILPKEAGLVIPDVPIEEGMRMKQVDERIKDIVRNLYQLYVTNEKAVE